MLLVAELHKAKARGGGSPGGPRRARTGRHIPVLKREVWERDQGQCAFVGAVGRCTERGFLEYHHRIPFADGGATNLDNLELRCRAHNAFEAECGSDRRRKTLVREARASFMPR